MFVFVLLFILIGVDRVFILLVIVLMFLNRLLIFYMIYCVILFNLRDKFIVIVIVLILMVLIDYRYNDKVVMLNISK